MIPTEPGYYWAKWVGVSYEIMVCVMQTPDGLNVKLFDTSEFEPLSNFEFLSEPIIRKKHLYEDVEISFSITKRENSTSIEISSVRGYSRRDITNIQYVDKGVIKREGTLWDDFWRCIPVMLGERG